MLQAMAYRGLSRHVDLESCPEPGDRFSLQELIGEGTYGEVYSARDTVTGDRCAIKILENVAENIEEIEEEYLVLRDLSLHPNIPSFKGLYLKRGSLPEEDQLWFVMELCTGGSVTDLVQGLKKRGENLNEEQIAYILRETVEALVYLHDNHCMHRDIKGHNILLTEEAQVKLVDFGVSSHLAATLGRRNTSVGTPYWMAPEVIACEQQLDSWYDARCDIWSLGITAIELAQGDPPLSDLHPMRALFQIPRNPPPQLERTDCPLLADFVAELLVKDLEQRPFAKEVLRHPLMKKGAVCAAKVKTVLQAEIKRQRVSGRCHRQPEVTTKHGKLKTDRKQMARKMYVDDLAALDILTEDSIVEQLQQRYEMNQIYTYIGDILVAVNPFTDLGMYSPKEQKRYCGQSRSSNPPHIFAVADAAYQALMHQRHSQSIVISGESGAGKTESGNLLLKQLVFLGKAPNRDLEARILQVNPIMEAFGNAQTGINANSSRFGKFLELSMTRGGRVTGARLSVYLLEQSRVAQQMTNEKNFHVFYYLYDGLHNDGRLGEFHLDPTLRQQHNFLTADSQDVLSRQNNVQKFKELKSAFEVVGFRDGEVNSIYRVMAGILHLGDIEFGEVVSDDNTDNKSRVIDLAPLHRASSLLGIEACDLLECLTANSVVTRGETITRNNSVVEAVATRDAMAKALYSRLFDWLVNCVNSLLCFSTRGEQLVVGILDIFGFENFAHNSFEQLCINIANEQIQYYFNQHIFTWEQQEYMAEGIPVDLVEFTDNRPVLDMLLSRPLGLLALLDEESRFPRSNDRSLIEKFHANIKSKLYIRPKSNALCFAIQHFAGRVVYQAEGFLDKNRHFLAPEVIQLLRTSVVDTVRYLFQCPITKTGNLFSASPVPTPLGTRESNRCASVMALQSQSRAQQTAATYFRYSLMELLQKMVAGVPQFVRCIKPNDSKSPRMFDPTKVVRQLRYTGVLETIRIRQHGFSHRIPFAEFLKRYCFLAFGFDERVLATRDNCRLMLVRLKMDGWALGKTKVFLKYYHIEYLSKLYEDQVRKIILVQSCIRRWLARSKYHKVRWEMATSVLTLQRYVRGWIARNRLQTLKNKEENRKNIAKNKAGRKQKVEKEKYISEKDRDMSSKQVQESQTPVSELGTPWGNVKMRRKFFSELEDKDEAATIIQSHFRGYTVRRHWAPEVAKRIHSDENAKKKPEAVSQVQGAMPVSPVRQKPTDRQHQLIILSQDVHMKNQDAHKYLRNNKQGINLNKIEEAKRIYGQKSVVHEVAKKHGASSYYQQVQDEMNSSSPDSSDEISAWDLPIIRLENQLRPLRPRMVTLSIEAERKDLMNVGRNHMNWHSPPVTPKPTPVSEDVNGPYDFRQLLRPTEHPPTESLRKRFSARCQNQSPNVKVS
ncbi:myosin-IIIb-like isoform X2 [Macrosteles quadrilineatus]|uniref:myosin-IIIb-like isoform X2 n=1 Tax=Macrosteles quadrilineatus TaxID=74068 RepID=UPI0023E0E0CE|nr:myosin-IIIb-like isoform X2 [Macrosteles quadrilineatus]